VDPGLAGTVERPGRWNGEDRGMMWIVELLSLLFLKARCGLIDIILIVLFQGKTNDKNCQYGMCAFKFATDFAPLVYHAG